MLCLGAQAYALEIVGVKLDNYIQLESHDLVINGAGMRSKYYFRLYVAALYLPERTRNVNIVLADNGAKRMLFHMLSDVSGKEMLGTLTETVSANHSAAEMKALQARLNAFSAMFMAVSKLKTGDVITFDYIPGTGTRVTIAGVVKGSIEGADFNRALLKIWVGDKPVQEDLKTSLLGKD